MKTPKHSTPRLTPARQRIVDLINLGRAALGKGQIDRLPLGKVDSVHDCVLGRALEIPIAGGCGFDGVGVCYVKHRVTAEMLSAAWGNTENAEVSSGFSVDLPKELNIFLYGFDVGAYPDLIEPGDEPPFWWTSIKPPLAVVTLREHMWAAGFYAGWKGEEAEFEAAGGVA